MKDQELALFMPYGNIASSAIEIAGIVPETGRYSLE